MNEVGSAASADSERAAASRRDPLPRKVRTLVETEGIAALYKGFQAIFVRKILWCSFFFFLYEAIPQHLTPMGGLL